MLTPSAIDLHLYFSSQNARVALRAAIESLLTLLCRVEVYQLLTKA